MSPFDSYLTARRGEYQVRLMRAEAELARVADWQSGRAGHFQRLAALYRDMLALLDRHDAGSP